MLEVSTQEPPSFRMGEDIHICRVRDLAGLHDDHPLKPLIVRCLDEDRHKRPDMKEVHTVMVSFVSKRLKAELFKEDLKVSLYSS